MNTDVILLIIAVAGLLVTFATTLYLVGYFRSASSSSVEEKDPRQAVAGGMPRNNNRGGLRALRHRRQGAAVVNENAEHRAQAVEVHDGADNDVEEATRVVGTSRKAMQKELKRQEREQLRKFEESRREEKKRQREAKEVAHRKRMEAADADDAAREADLEAMRLRQEAEDQVEFDKWRALISVEDAGVDADVVDGSVDGSNLLLQAFVEYIEVHHLDRSSHAQVSSSYVEPQSGRARRRSRRVWAAHRGRAGPRGGAGRVGSAVGASGRPRQVRVHFRPRDERRRRVHPDARAADVARLGARMQPPRALRLNQPTLSRQC
ncbi:hypothetical protein H257_13546 [Aphanomyces astaci]|uniref:DDRGK domain-containing protein 1 n=1 Tax=Aphanomyces astaci TaxID=112090 RepID=W4FW53_APHAT|nr:hypothetical protein H257_13546 [Aphanomyces astaci]ETV71151.1 hypothetical protein H257_13546 [Aphanomyces astaci]|eukprot:XP_009839397.1 hypothetical protein H257_13546 [Aphanomyces astaci]